MISEYLPLIMGVLSFLGAGATWYDAAARKRYSAERAVNTLTNNYGALSRELSMLTKLVDDRFDTLQRENLELKLLIQMLMTQSGCVFPPMGKRDQ